jgi:hypothetical protein
MTLKEKCKKALIDIRFINRIKEMLANHPHDVTMENYQVSVALELLKNMGYPSKYHRGESFYKYVRNEGKYEVVIHLSLKYGVVDFMLYLANTNTGDRCGGPFGSLYRQIDVNLVIGKPGFNSYEELKEVLQTGLGIIEDLKTEITKQDI